VELDARPGDDHAGARAGRDREGGGVAALIHDGNVGRAARRRRLRSRGGDAHPRDRLPYRALRVEPLRQATAIEIPSETLVAHASLLAHHLDEGRYRFGAAWLPAPAEQPQAV